MAAKKDQRTAASPAPSEAEPQGTLGDGEDELPAFVHPEGLISLIKRYPQYDPMLDARDRANLGQVGPPIHALVLGQRQLPATIADSDTGELQPWHVLVLELLQATPVKEARDPMNPRVVPRSMAKPGTHIIFTVTVALASIKEQFGLDAVIADPKNIFEVLIVPEVSKTSKGLSLWKFKEFSMGNPRPRLSHQSVNPFSHYAIGRQLEGAPSARALGTGASPGYGQVVEQSGALAPPSIPGRSPVG